MLDLPERLMPVITLIWGLSTHFIKEVMYAALPIIHFDYDHKYTY